MRRWIVLAGFGLWVVVAPLSGCSGSSGAEASPSPDAAPPIDATSPEDAAADGVDEDTTEPGFDAASGDDSDATAEEAGGADAADVADGSTVMGDANAGADAGADADADAPFFPASHPPFPTVQSGGGPVLTAPNVVPIFFPGDTLQSNVEAFLTQLAGSSYWTTVTSEYGAGPLRVAPSIIVTDAPPLTITDDQIQTWLAAGIGTVFPAADPNNVYAIFYPEATQVSFSTDVSCTDFGGYHYEGSLGPSDAGGPGGLDGGDASAGSSFTYVVIPRCPTSITQTQLLTESLSHELVESATDPLIASNPAYTFVDDADFAWSIHGAEIADLCESESVDRLAVPFAGTFLAARAWSNAAARLGNVDPCVPAIAAPFLGAFADVDAALPVQTDTGPMDTLGVRVPLGQTVMVNVRAFSTGPVSPWQVLVTDVQSPPTVTVHSTGNAAVNNGDVLQVALTRVADSGAGGSIVSVQSFTPPPITGATTYFFVGQ